MSRVKPKIQNCSLEGEILQLHPYAGLFYPKTNTLIVSDTHFGKVTHFRKNGIAIPYNAIQKNWDRLAEMIVTFNPERIVFLGDLFHSSHNHEWESFTAFYNTFALPMTLVLGNHDILHPTQYDKVDLEVVDVLHLGPFLWSHHPVENCDKYNIHGHIHPAVKLKGVGRQSMKLACFYFGKQYGVLPAFGNFTGTATIVPEKDAQVYAILESTCLVQLDTSHSSP